MKELWQGFSLPGEKSTPGAERWESQGCQWTQSLGLLVCPGRLQSPALPPGSRGARPAACCLLLTLLPRWEQAVRSCLPPGMPTLGPLRLHMAGLEG